MADATDGVAEGDGAADAAPLLDMSLTKKKKKKKPKVPFFSNSILVAVLWSWLNSWELTDGQFVGQMPACSYTREWSM